VVDKMAGQGMAQALDMVPVLAMVRPGDMVHMVEDMLKEEAVVEVVVVDKMAGQGMAQALVPDMVKLVDMGHTADMLKQAVKVVAVVVDKVAQAVVVPEVAQEVDPDPPVGTHRAFI
jgi:predicted GNAT family acetyltransferase